MATVSDVTLDDIVQTVNARVNQDTDALVSSDDDYTLITRLANMAINRWEKDNGVLWNELWTNTADNGTGAVLTVADGTATYACPTAMAFAGGWVKVQSGSQEYRYPVVKPEEAQKASVNSEERFAYFTGNPQAGFTLHLHPTPDSTIDTWTIKYDYYKKADKLVNTTDKPEMSDPYFIIDYVSSELIREEDPTRWQTFRQDAEEKLKEMEARNMLYPPYQGVGYDDAQLANDGLVLGE